MALPLSYAKITDHPVLTVDWTEIPKFAVITGPNGSGKTKLLEAFYEVVSKVSRKTGPSVSTDLALGREECGFVRWNDALHDIPNVSPADIEAGFSKFVTRCKARRPDRSGEPRLQDFVKQELATDDILGKPDSFYVSPEFRNAYERAAKICLNTSKNEHVAQVFLTYLKRFEREVLEARDPATGTSPKNTEVYETIGRPPWEIINVLFEEFDFKYRVSQPVTSDVPFVPVFRPTLSDETEVRANELSSGEIMIVSLVLWTFDEEVGQTRKLLLLDEPDAHLHPDMARSFIRIVKEELVGKQGVQVIMTTHSPTTLCWLEAGDVFGMENGKGVTPVELKTAISDLSAGLINVNLSTKVVLVEANDDREFYSDVYRQLVDMDKLPRVPALEFRSVVTSEEEAGGKTKVVSTVKKFTEVSDGTDLKDWIWGLVDADHDDNSTLPPTIKHLPRYCFENFLADPVLMFVALIEENVGNDLLGELAVAVRYSAGDTLKLKRNEEINFQDIVDGALGHLQADSDRPDMSDGGTFRVRYVNGAEVELPVCFRTESGKDVLWKWYKRVYKEGSAKVNPSVLRRYLVKTGLYSCDLVDVFKSLVGSDA